MIDNNGNQHWQTQVTVESTQLINDTYTQYDIHIRLLRQGIVNWETHIHKRFSDFITLRQQMVNEIGNADFPYELPNKQFSLWAKQTSISKDVIGERKTKLEKFLYDMLNDSFDNKWRDTQTVARFLNIPKRWSDMISGHNTFRESVTRDTDNDKENWLSSYRDCKNDFEECKSAVVKDRTRMLIRLRLKVNQLEKAFEDIENVETTIESPEIERRKNLLALLKVDINELSMQQSFEDNGNDHFDKSPSPRDGTIEFKGTLKIGETTRHRVGRRRLGETETTAQLNNMELLTMHKDKLKSQDQELIDLHKIIQNQKAISIQMNQELSQQNELLDSFSNDVDQTANKLNVATRRATKFNESL
ncbi:similar to Saccharomyces cerevisiae YGL212W VAM7 Vacuolar SNARE protein that functions with Vam3p in vacuolar protein trafficking [Maudiozyma barnettii]|uniref:Similar to Saccharomyces cerevisiae YGL212W VAM7 Vacuolar SNARE protein that functions with Vam3p in vacuolar protein trafficking n=1 Tax=Maudiozyma barnettii TaxID=61262 RepID=A0A8H2VB21_9SACH|nr:Vam7p [Kazachstania barnettii]CAB4251985.1 similar to Saccharomyces cerevisiae YGL212W VAM7 Vacuolar SNARE protein that functions with Vam3p in vacuolar protein trafficking [Kazachstania barnettii]CAD1778389.1 similar to Saccharomyces cerevisiae YGL212W VAM7 Vacuolar SNARE protein that functions with Vam3p in vacuolar protein trafficking [Kazachstania barnettii]